MSRYCKNIIVLFFILILCNSNLFGQVSVRDSIVNVNIVGISGGGGFPLGSLAKDYGMNANVGASYYYKTNKNFLIGVEWSYLFGKNVKNAQEIFDMVLTSNNDIINYLGQFAIVSFYQRGHSGMIKAGKIFPVGNYNDNSGIYITGGVGALFHKIRIEVKDNDTPQLNPEYRRGYDHARLGPSIGFESGYIFFDNQRLINFKIGLEASYSLTKCIRPYNFDTMSKDENWYNDILIGLKASWLLPLYPKTPKKFYY